MQLLLIMQLLLLMQLLLVKLYISAKVLIEIIFIKFELLPNHMKYTFAVINNYCTLFIETCKSKEGTYSIAVGTFSLICTME